MPAGRPGPDRPRQPSRLRRVLRRTLYVKCGLLALLVLVVAALYGRLVYGPVSLSHYSTDVADALATRLGPGWRVTLRDTALELHGANPAVRASGLEIRNPAGIGLLRAPEAVVSLDAVGLVIGRIAPRAIELKDLQLRALVAPDGSLSFATVGDGQDPPPPPVPPPVAAAPAEGDAGAERSSVVAHAVGSLLAPLLAPTGLVGSLDRARVTNARLTLVGTDGRERVGFSRVDALFARQGEAARQIDIDLVGPHGAWRVGGAVSAEGATRQADIAARDVPLDDVMLLTGLAPLPDGSDLKLSGTATAAFDGARLTRLDGRFASSAGQIARNGQTPVRIDGLGGVARWDEARRRLALEDVDLRSAGSAVRLAGELQPLPDHSWQLQVTGRDALVAGATQADKEFRVADVAAAVRIGETGAVIDAITLKGDAVDVTVTGRSVSAPDGTGVSAVITAVRTDVRRLFALWPDMINPELRHYLFANMRGGFLDRIEIRTDLGAEDFRAATSGRPISDEALDLRFALSNTRLTVIDGLPPLTQLSVTGRATGTTTTLAAPRGIIEMPDGRKLGFQDGSYAQRDEHKPGSVAQIGFRVDGGADALASFLRSPIFKDFGSFDMDPTTVKGRVDLKAAIPLVVNNIPRASELPLAVTGTLQDITADRIFGKDRLDGGQFTVSYVNGALALHGDGRLGGSPATIDLRQAKGAPLDANVALTLDEAARARRSLPTAPALAGPVLVKVATTLGGGKSPVRFDVDLGKAAIEGLLPGWQKPAGKPGRLAFTLPTGETGDVRDIVVDAAPVQIRGTAAFGSDGSVERADLPTLKLSQGDDVRAQLDRQGGVYRVALRGNVADIRPVLKWVTASGGGSPGGGGGGGGKSLDADVDLAVNILTGHNDEALTGAVAKVSVRNRDLRAIQVKGQFRGAPLEIGTGRREGAPVVTVQAADAGATLRFLDLYKRMAGGVMTAQTTTGDVQAGTVTIDNFTIRNEPALKRIAAQAPAAGDERNGGARFEGEQVQFAKLQAEFRKTAARVEYKDVVVYGAQAGFNLSGFVDYGRDRTDIVGTFVPAYGLNNAFSQLPVIGLILGGGRNEGLFAVDFRVSGAASSPTMTINPLSVVAPGILRKLFGWALPPAEDATGTTAPKPAAPRRTP